MFITEVNYDSFFKLHVNDSVWAGEKISFSRWTEWTKIGAVPFSNVSVLATNPDRRKGKVSVPGLIATNLYQSFSDFYQ